MTFKNYRKQKRKKQKEFMRELLQEKIDKIDKCMTEMKKSTEHNIIEVLNSEE